MNGPKLMTFTWRSPSLLTNQKTWGLVEFIDDTYAFAEDSYPDVGNVPAGVHLGVRLEPADADQGLQPEE